MLSSVVFMLLAGAKQQAREKNILYCAVSAGNFLVFLLHQEIEELKKFNNEKIINKFVHYRHE